jgi:hypothetical protein
MVRPSEHRLDRDRSPGRSASSIRGARPAGHPPRHEPPGRADGGRRTRSATRPRDCDQGTAGRNRAIRTKKLAERPQAPGQWTGCLSSPRFRVRIPGPHPPELRLLAQGADPNHGEATALKAAFLRRQLHASVKHHRARFGRDRQCELVLRCALRVAGENSHLRSVFASARLNRQSVVSEERTAGPVQPNDSVLI